jgi:hypothetical protein
MMNDMPKEFLDDIAARIRADCGVTTIRYASRFVWCLRKTARDVLELMIERGYGRWVIVPSGPKGGRPAKVFVLDDDSTKLEQPAEGNHDETAREKLSTGGH